MIRKYTRAECTFQQQLLDFEPKNIIIGSDKREIEKRERDVYVRRSTRRELIQTYEDHHPSFHVQITKQVT